MMVGMLSSHRWNSSSRLRCLFHLSSIPKLAEFGGRSLPVFFLVAMMILSLNLRSYIVLVLLRQCLSMLYWLDSRVVVVPVDLSINCFAGFLMSVRLDDLVGHGGIDTVEC